MQTKMCSMCNQEFTLDKFHKNAKGKDGLRSYCKTCGARKVRNYRHTGKTFLSTYDTLSTNKLTKMIEDIRMELDHRNIGFTYNIEITPKSVMTGV